MEIKETDIERIKRLKVARVKCDADLLFFTRFFFKVIKNQKFIINWHHDDICLELTKVANYETLFLNINIPPRHSKTELAINFIAQNLGKNPHGNYLYITASDDLRSETSVKIRDIITTREYQDMYGVRLKKDQNAKNLWRTEEGGGLKTATISGQITGFGAGQMIEHDPDLEEYLRDFEGCIVLDDINKIADAVSLSANNKKTNARIFDTVLSRKNSEDTPMINIQQRAGLEDATSVLLEFFEGKGKIKNLVLPIVYKGRPLWPWKHSMGDIEAMKIHPLTKETFQSQYMQDPKVMEGVVFAESELKRFSEIPTEVEIIDGKEERVLQGWTLMCIDPADEGKDYFAGPVAQIIPPFVYVFDAIFDQDNLTLQEGAVVGKVKLHRVRKIVVETNAAGAYFQRRLRELNPGLEFYGKWNKANKMGRILAYSGLIMKYFKFPMKMTGALELFMEKVTRLLKTSTDEDDAPDSLSLMAEHLELHYQMFIEK